MVSTRGTTGSIPARQGNLERAAQLFKHVADPTRLAIVLMLVDDELSSGAIWKAIGLTQPTVSNALTLLKVGGVVEARRLGQTNIYSLTELGRKLAELIAEIS